MNLTELRKEIERLLIEIKDERDIGYYLHCCAKLDGIYNTIK